MKAREILSAIFSRFAFFKHEEPAVQEQPALAEIEQTPVPEPAYDDQGRVILSNRNFKPLLRMFNTGAADLKAAIAKAAADRTSDNLHDVAFELYRILEPYQIHFVMGNEELWEDSVRKMISLADESAAPGTSINALNLAGIIAGSPWQMAYSGGPIDAMEKVERPAVAEPDFAKALKYFEAGEKLGDQTCASNAENARKIIAHLAEQAAAPKAGTLAEGLSGLTRMNTSESLSNAIAAADAERTPENAYKLAHEIYQVVYDESWFVLGNEGVWANAVKTMQQLAEEGANGGVADSMLLAGVIAGRTWQIGGTVSGPGEGGKWESEDVTQPAVIERDDEKALAWFEKGAALGHDYCTKNAEIARRVIAEKAAKTNPSSSTPPTPPPPA